MSRSRGSLLGSLVSMAVIGLGAWGGYALGVTLGLSGGIALLAGGGIIAGGILAVGLVAVAGISIFQVCRSRYSNWRSRNQVIENQAQQGYGFGNGATSSIHRGLDIRHDVSRQAGQSRVYPYVKPVTYPPVYQEPQGRPQQVTNPYEVPPCQYSPNT